MSRPRRSVDLFLLHAPHDDAWVQGYLQDGVTRAAIRCFHGSLPPEALTPEHRVTLARTIQQSERLVVVLSPQLPPSHLTTLAEHLSHVYGEHPDQWPVILLSREPIDRPAPWGTLPHIDASSPNEWPHIIQHLCELFQRPAPADVPAPACPYPGLLPFAETDHPIFFGRDQEVHHILAQLRHVSALTMSGGLGSGKTSLINAGLVPALRTLNTRLADSPTGTWLVRILRPGRTPLASLRAALAHHSLSSPAHALEALQNRYPTARRMLLIIDQVEELFLHAPDDATPFQQALLNLCTVSRTDPSPLPVYLLLSTRTDRVPDLMNSPVWHDIPHQHFELPPLQGDALRHAVQRPAKHAGVFLDEALVTRLQDDVTAWYANSPPVDYGQTPPLALLQETMHLLWPHLHGRYLSLADYNDLCHRIHDSYAPSHHLPNAIGHRADTLLGSLTPEHYAITRHIFTHLCRNSHHCPQPLSALRPPNTDPLMVEHTLRTLINHRLLTIRTSGMTPNDLISEVVASEQRARLVTAPCDTLLPSWGTLRHWLDTQTQIAPPSTPPIHEQLEETRPDSPNYQPLSPSGPQQRQPSAPHEQDDHTPTPHPNQVTSPSKLSSRFWSLVNVAIFFMILILVGHNIGWIPPGTLPFLPNPPSPDALMESMVAHQTAESERDRAEQQLHAVIARQLAAQARDRMTTEPDLALLLAAQATAFLSDTSNTSPGTTHLLAAAEAQSSLLTILESSPDLMMLLPGEGGIVSSVAFSPNGNVLATASCASSSSLPEQRPSPTTCARAEIRIWDIRTTPTHEPIVLTGHTDMITSLVFSADGMTLASASMDTTVILWDMQRHTRRATMPGHTEPVIALAFDPTSHLLASAGWDRQIILWDTITTQPIGDPLRGHTNSINALAFHPNGHTLVSGSWDGTIRRWDIDTRESIGKPLEGHAFAVSSLAFHPDGHTLASGGVDGVVLLWNEEYTSATPLDTAVASQNGQASPIVSLAFRPDGEGLAGATNDSMLLTWEYTNDSAQPTLQRVLRLPPPPRALPTSSIVPPLLTIAFRPDSTMLLSGSNNSMAFLWDMSRQDIESENPRTLVQHLTSPSLALPTSIAISGDGQKLAVGHSDATITLWATSSPTLSLLTTLHGHTDMITSVAFSPDGHTLAAASLDSTITLWPIQNRYDDIEPMILQGHADAVTSVIFHPDGATLVSASLDGSILRWDVGNGRPTGPPLHGHAFGVYHIAISPDGQFLASGGRDTTILLWDLQASQPAGPPLEGHTDPIVHLAFSPDNRLLASMSTEKLILWDIATRQAFPMQPLADQAGTESTDSLPLYQSFRPLTAPSLAFRPDGHSLAASTHDHGVALWDVPTRQVIGHLSPPRSSSLPPYAPALAFHPDGHTLFTTSSSTTADGQPRTGMLLQWDVALSSWQRRACRIANRTLTMEEWQRFVGPDIPYQDACGGEGGDRKWIPHVEHIRYPPEHRNERTAYPSVSRTGNVRRRGCW